MSPAPHPAVHLVLSTSGGNVSGLEKYLSHATAGNSNYTLQHGLLLLPYKFLYAAQLAEHGLVSEAAQYCGAIQQALGALSKLPPALAVCKAFTQELLDRLQTYAAVSALNNSFHAHICHLFICRDMLQYQASILPTHWPHA